ncbi:ABC transporter permease [Dokdonella fugitiva]|uniref:Putative ABC transport system permease protein n=1 Tax=Dokdonella fugitiva TaxID=328517 RepID=A0A4R2IBB9_9GAMM|nr:ABC transporter permease [Dokdonella fugitiva]TCO41804.1 putative ABC transport system permease protein [Dokdonella fugitiva]
MVPLARKTLVHEWRRFLPSALAVAFSGLLLLVQAALVFGIFNSSAVYIRKSGGELWLGYPGTQSIELGRPIPQQAEIAALMDPAVERVEPFNWIDGDWRGPADKGGVSVFVSGIDTRSDALMFADALTPALRALLDEPDGVIVDRADLPKLGLDVGGQAVVNGHRVRIVGVGSGLRALGGVNIVTSLATSRRLDNGDSDGRVAYYVVKLRDGSDAAAVRQRLQPRGQARRFEVWTRDAFARRAVAYWMFETGAGLGVVLLAIVVFVVGALITSQTLMGAVAGSIREYATLHALGVGFARLRRVVLEQAAWVGAFGLVVGGVATALVVLLAHRRDVPVQLDLVTVAICATLVMGIALLSGLAAVRALRHADPALLLR